MLRRVRRWFDDRLGLSAVKRHLLDHPIPAEVASRKGWMYVFGAATLAAFLVQVVTGVGLATTYIPAPGHAHETLRFLTEETRLGWLLRGLHFYGASAMVFLVFVHMARVFLTGSYKFPREMNWISGAVLLGLTLAMAGTGQLLRWDEDGLWTVLVWAKFAQRVPIIGEGFAEFILAGDTVGGATLSRFFALHVFVFPALIVLFIGLHLYLVLYHGVSEPPKAGEPVERWSYRERYEALLARGRPYWPDGAWREAVTVAVVVATVALLALLLGPKGPAARPDPTLVEAVPKPDWFFLWYYTLVWLKPPRLETLVMVYLPLGVGVVLFLLPLLFGRGERHPARRPWAILAVALTVIVFATLTGLGVRAPWIPNFETEPIPATVLAGVAEPVHDGARLFYERGCQYCHRALGYGGDYGPDLTRVASRLSPEEITLRTVNGIGNMPAYRDTLTFAELESIVAFLLAAERRAR